MYKKCASSVTVIYEFKVNNSNGFFLLSQLKWVNDEYCLLCLTFKCFSIIVP